VKIRENILLNFEVGYSASDRNEYQKIFLREKSLRPLRLTNLLSSLRRLSEQCGVFNKS
jgi:hypothetical protein